MPLRPCGATVGRSFSDLSLGGRWGFSPQTLARGLHSPLDSHSGGIIVGRRPGSRRASRACGGHGAQRVRRDAKPARLPLSVTAYAVTPSPPGQGGFAPFRGCARSGGAPLRSPRFAHACALRHGRERRRPPAEADGGYSGSSGHAPLRKNAASRTCRLGGRWGSSPQTLARGLHSPLDSHSGGSGWVGGPARRGRAGLAGVTAHSGCAATRNMRGSPYPSRHLP